MVYIDDRIVFGPNDKAIDEVVNDLRLSSKNFTLNDQGEVGDFLGIQIQTRDDGSIVLTQSQLLDSIIQDLHLQSGSNPKKTINHHQAITEGCRRARHDPGFQLS